MDPVRGFWQIFTGRPDIYEVARRRAEEAQSTGDVQQTPGTEEPDSNQ